MAKKNQKGKFSFTYPFTGTKEVKKEIRNMRIEFTDIEFSDQNIVVHLKEPLSKLEEILLRNIIDKYDGGGENGKEKDQKKSQVKKLISNFKTQGVV